MRLVLVAAAAAVIMWTVYRAGQDARPASGGEGNSAGDASTAAAANEGQARRTLLTRSSGDGRAATTAGEDRNRDAVAEMTPERFEEVRREREGLYRQLSQDGDPLMGELEQALAASGAATPAAVGSAWRLVQNWRVFLGAEAENETKIEDAALRQELTAARRTILLESPTRELERLLEGRSGARVFMEMEAIARRLYSASPGGLDARTRSLMGAPEIPRAPRARRVEVDPE